MRMHMQSYIQQYQIRWENWWLGLGIWCLVKRVGLGFMLQLEKEK